MDVDVQAELTRYAARRSGLRPLRAQASRAPCAQANEPRLLPRQNTMKERLIRESAGLGADPNQKNPFLPVFFGVGVFVLLGALAVNM